MPRLVPRSLFPAALCVIFALSATAETWNEGGYTSRTSVLPGQSIDFHIATATSPFSVEIVNLARPSTVLTTLSGLTSAARDCTGMWENGCGWPVTTTFTIPSGWPSGYYAAKFPTSAGTRHTIFIVRSATPGISSRMVAIATTNTYFAYNRFGGKSVYDTLSTDNQRAHIVSLNRPYSDNNGLGRYPLWEQQFVDWMTAEGRAFDVIADEDLEDPAALDPYTTVLIVGHSEYWTLRARQHLESFVAGGGHVAIFGGNTMWWQSRLNPDTRQFIVYKSASLDPEPDDDIVTVNWFDDPVYNPENFILGASFRHGGYVNKYPDPSYQPLPVDERTPYTVVDPSSWIFEGTGVADGQLIGQAAAGIEVDGAIFNTLPNGDVVVDGSDGTPLNFQILAILGAGYGYGTMGLYTHPSGGTVFNSGTRDWPHGLAHDDAVIERMTRNVLDRFVTGDPLPYVPRTSDSVTEDLFNTPTPGGGVLPGWRRNLLRSRLSARCAEEGASGLELTGTQWTQLLRRFVPGRDGLREVQLDFSVNADLLESTPSHSSPLVSLVNHSNAATKIFAAVEFQLRSEGKSVRLALRRADGTRSVSTNWVALAAGFQRIGVTWRSGGAVELRVGANAPLTATNPESGQSVTDLMIEYPGSDYGVSGAMCVDRLQLRNLYVPPPSPETSTITADPTSIVADGVATSAITVQLRDAAGANVTTGGHSVVLSTTAGALSTVTDHGNGTYTATLTSATAPATATVSGTLDGAAMTSTATVSFVAGPAASFEVTAPPSVAAQTPFDITVTARDAHGNVATSYSGTVHFTSSDPAATLPADSTLVAGVKRFSVTLRSTGTQTITAADGALTGSASMVVKGRTSVALTSSPNPSNPGASVTLTATVTAVDAGPALTGSVSFFDGPSLLGTVAISGTTATLATSALASGPHSLTATYSGDASFAGSTSPAHAHNVTLAAPSSIAAAATGTNSVAVSWSAVNFAATYEVERSTGSGAFARIAVVNATSYSDTTVAASTVYLYRVRAVDGNGVPGATSARAPATTIVFTADARRIIRAAHMTELRNAINVFRQAFGLAAATYSTPSITAGMRIRAADLREMRDALNEARAAAGLPLLTFEPLYAGVTKVKASHMRELQQGIGGKAWT